MRSSFSPFFFLALSHSLSRNRMVSESNQGGTVRRISTNQRLGTAFARPFEERREPTDQSSIVVDESRLVPGIRLVGGRRGAWERVRPTAFPFLRFFYFEARREGSARLRRVSANQLEHGSPFLLPMAVRKVSSCSVLSRGQKETMRKILDFRRTTNTKLTRTCSDPAFVTCFRNAARER